MFFELASAIHNVAYTPIIAGGSIVEVNFISSSLIIAINMRKKES